jgi:hypothetical protein
MNILLQNSATLLSWEKPLHTVSGVQKYRVPGRRGDYILWILNMELALFLPSIASKFEVASKVLYNLYTPAVDMSRSGFQSRFGISCELNRNLSRRFAAEVSEQAADTTSL